MAGRKEGRGGRKERGEKEVQTNRQKENPNGERERKKRGTTILDALLSYTILASFYLRSNATIYYIYVIYIYHICISIPLS